MGVNQHRSKPLAGALARACRRLALCLLVAPLAALAQAAAPAETPLAALAEAAAPVETPLAALAQAAAPVETPLAALAEAATPVETPITGAALFEQVGDSEQIPEGVITALAQDALGFIWIGTTDGLVRYDGYRFRRYLKNTNDPDSLPGNRVQHLLTGNDGRLWVGTYSDGVAVYDAGSDSFVRFQSDPQRLESLPPGTVRAMAQTPDGAIWVGTTGTGLARIDPDGQVRRFEARGPGAALFDDRISALGVDQAGTLWLGSWQGLSRLVAGAERFESVLSDPDDPQGFANTTIRGIHVAANGDVWIGAQQGQMARLPAAVLRAPGSPPPQPQEVQRWRGAGLNDAVEPGDGSLWVAHSRGIDVYSSDSGQLLALHRHRAVDSMSISNTEVRALLIDRSGWVWAGSFGGGLQRTQPLAQALYSRRFDPLGDAPLTQLSTLSLAESRDGGLWLGVANNGLARMDADLRIREFLRVGDPQLGALEGQQPSGIVESEDGHLWVATERGLFLRAPEQTEFERISGPDFLEGAAVRRLWMGPGGQLWIATGDGLFRRGPDGELQRLGTVDGVRVTGSINALVFDGQGGWVGGSSGLFRLSPDQRVLLPVQSVAEGAPVTRDVLGLLVDRQGQLWMDADGLYRLQSSSEGRAEFEAISARHGHAGVAFGAHLLDGPDGRIWTHRFVYDPHADQLHRLGRADGAHAGTGWFRAYARLPDGRMAFGATGGLLLVSAERFSRWAFEPPLVFSGLRLDGEPARFGPGVRRLEIAPGVRNFQLEFAALDFSAPELLRYRHRLLDVEGDWVPSDARTRDAGYGGLWPGDYRLQVQGSNRAGEFSPRTLELEIRVLPHWWQTSTALTVAVLSLIGLVLMLVGWREKRLRIAKAQLEAQVSARTAELSALSAELGRKNRDFEEASLSDPLTGLRNRRFAMQELPREVSLCLRRMAEAGEGSGAQARGLVLFLIDLDHFKAVNDDHGHAAGDAVLCEFADRLRTIFRSSDHLIRWGGEEFLAVARDSSREGAVELAERVRRMMADHPFLLQDGSAIRRTVSIGFAPFPLLPALPAAAGWEEVVDLIDQLMYAAKRCGRNAWIGLFPERAEALPRHAWQWSDPALIRAGAASFHSSVNEGKALQALGESLQGADLGA
jgi:diguanylate cyclase (GGDEF)-like protein